ncbi:PPP4R2-domain-containing protein [Heliocybe sulcata]|uniref:PPP4R2-domain-containing protein n=1 Tax=Heliocybe sulcata TaxID=5364 RepID=A0A5C3NEQ3_9AGAM|nr:PPP4R2-domain-containing protein [Heliocybe sulcata]
MSEHDPYGVPADFEWAAEYDTILEQVASTDIVETAWQKLRDVIKYKISQNVDLYLSEVKDQADESSLLSFSPRPSTSGGLKLPPFPPRPNNELNPNVIPKVHLAQEEANGMKKAIFVQLHEFDENPPFTIQRVCELCVRPKEHYNNIGKYLRAVEKSLLVTSTWDAFPPPTSGSQNTFASISLPTNTSPLPSAPATPMFSPIPFLHDDARRSKSRSPPPSPLALTAMDKPGATANDDPAVLGASSSEQKVLGLVDELDDPSPGHLSDHPTALSATTDIPAERSSKPLFGTLNERFVSSSGSTDVPASSTSKGEEAKESQEARTETQS